MWGVKEKLRILHNCAIIVHQPGTVTALAVIRTLGEADTNETGTYPFQQAARPERRRRA